MKNTSSLGLREKKRIQPMKELSRYKYELLADLAHDIVNQLTFLTLCSFKLRTSFGQACPQELDAIEIAVGKIADLIQKLAIQLAPKKISAQKKQKAQSHIPVLKKGNPPGAILSRRTD